MLTSFGGGFSVVKCTCSDNRTIGRPSYVMRVPMDVVYFKNAITFELYSKEYAPRRKANDLTRFRVTREQRSKKPVGKLTR